MTVTSAQVTTLLENVLFESSTQAKANATTWTAIANLSSNTSTVAGLATYLASQPEAGIAEQVVRYYMGALGRVPSAVEIAYYVKIAETGLNASQIAQGASGVAGSTWAQIAAYFAASPEFQTDFGLGTTGITTANEALVITGFYNNILGRAPTSAEISYYENLLNTGTSAATLIQYFTESPENQAKVDTSIATGLANFGTAVAGGSTSTTITVSTPVSTTSVALTTGVDTLTPTGNVAISGTANGSGATFTPGDSINGSGTGNSLSLSDTATVSTTNWTPTSLSGVLVSGVQTVTLSSSEGITADFTGSQGWTGLTTLNVTSEGQGTHAESITVGAGTAVNWTDTLNVDPAGAGDSDVTVNGGSAVSVTVNNNAALTDSGSSITINGGSGTTSVTVTQTEGTATFDESVSIVDTNGGSTSKAGTITSVTLNGLDTQGATISDNSLSTLAVDNATTATVSISQNATFAAANTAATTLTVTVDGDTSLILQDTNNTYKTLTITGGSTNAQDSSLLFAAAAADTHFTGVTALTINGSGEVIFTDSVAPSDLAADVASAFAAVTSLTISGTAGLSADLSGLAATLTSVTSTAGAGNITNLTLGAGQAFSHTGAGQDIITVTAAPTAALAAGSATNNELVVDYAGTGLQTSLLGSGGSVTGFTVLGTGSASTGTYDLTTNAGFTAIDVTGASAGDLSFVRAAATTSLAIDAAVGAHNVTFTSADSSGASDTLALTLGIAKSDARVADGIATASTASFTAVTDTLTVADSAGTGFATIDAVVNATTAGAQVTIGTLADTDLSTLAVSGTAGLVLTSFTDDTSAAFTLNNTSTGTGASSIGTFTDASLATLTFTGSGVSSIGILNDSVSTLTIAQNDTHSGALTITTITDANLSTLDVSGTGALTVTNLVSPTGALFTLDNTSSATLTVGAFTDDSMSTLDLLGTGKIAVTTLTDTATTITVLDSDAANVSIATFTAVTAASETFQNTGAGTLSIGGTANTGADVATLNLLGKVAYTASADAVTTAITVLGSSDNGNVSLTFSGTEATGTTQSVTLGNGNNTVDFSVTGAGATAIRDVTVGNGDNTITDINTGSTDVINVSVGTGLNTVTLGVGHSTDGDTITFSAANGGSVSSFTTINNLVHTIDTLVWATASLNTTINYESTHVSSAAAGISAANLADGINIFYDGANSWVYEYTGSAATSELVKVAGVNLVTADNSTVSSTTHFHI